MNAFPTGGAPFCCRFDRQAENVGTDSRVAGVAFGSAQSLRPSIDSEFAKQLHKSL
jgi:hypothetical protein